MQYNPHAALHAEQGIWVVCHGGRGMAPGKGLGVTQAEALFYTSSVALEPVEAQPPHFSPPYDDKSLEEQLWPYECLSLKCHQNVWLTRHFVNIQLIQSNNISLLNISDNMAFWGYWLTLEGRILTLIWIEISHSQNLMSLLEKWNIMGNAVGD